MRIDIMTDIETLGTDSDSTIIQIAAVAFDIQTGRKVDTFSKIVNISLNKLPIKSTGSTLQWWLKTSPVLFSEIINGGELSSEDTLRHFHEWLLDLSNDYGYKNLYLWGNGILFDNKMIQHQMQNIGLEYPIYYRNDRDLRTLVDLAATKTNQHTNDILNSLGYSTLVTHNAMDDVRFQIKLACHCYDILMGNESKGV